MGFVCIKVWGFTLLILSNFYNISHENEFHFHRIHKNGGWERECGCVCVCGGGEFKRTPEPPLDPQLG